MNDSSAYLQKNESVFVKTKTPWVKKSVLPGFGLSLGYAAFYASLIVFIPLAGLVLKSLELSWEQLWQVISNR